MVLGLKLAAAAAALWLAVSFYMFIIQRSLLYHPDAGRPLLDPQRLPGMVEVTFPTADGLTLAAWHAPARNGRETVILFHGNAGNRGYLEQKARPYLAAGFGLLLVDYRGYGGNPGQPSESGLMADARAARAFVLGQGVAADRLIYHGESLGSGVAVALAAETPPARLILEAAYTSIPDVGALKYWWLPVRLAARDRFESLDRIGGITAPLLVLHGEKDSLIPVRQGRALAAAHPGPKTLILYPEGRHADLYDHGAGRDILAWLT